MTDAWQVDLITASGKYLDLLQSERTYKYLDVSVHVDYIRSVCSQLTFDLGNLIDKAKSEVR